MTGCVTGGRRAAQIVIVCAGTYCSHPLLAQSAPAVAPNPAELQFRSADAAFQAGEFAAAAEQLERLVREVPNSFPVHELLGLAYAQSHDVRAVGELKTAVLLQPDSAAARTNLATALLQVHKPAEAESEFRKALVLDPHDYSANHSLAGLLAQANRVAEAIPFFKAAQQARPDAYDNGYDLALAYFLAGRSQEAHEVLATLIAERDTGELHNLQGRIDERAGNFVEAGNEFAAAAHMDPSEDHLFAWASELLLHRTYVPAIEVFRQGTQMYPGSARLRIGLGMALYSRGEYAESIRALLTAIDLDPRDPRSYRFLSKAYLSSPGQAQEVIQRFRRYADLEPDNASALYYYAISLWKGQRMDDPHVDYQIVESLFRRSIALNPNVAEVHLQLGILYTEEQAYAKSLPEYERASQLDPNLPDVHFRLGRYYLRAGDKQRGKSELDLFEKLHVQHQAELDKERAEVQQFVMSAQSTSTAAQP